MVGMERAYDFQELLGAANTVNRLSQMEYGKNGIKFGRVNKKMTNISAKLYKLADDEVEPDLGDYSAISSNEEVVTALKEGFKEAQKMIHSLNMALNPQATTKNKLWFDKLWVVECADTQSFVFAAVFHIDGVVVSEYQDIIDYLVSQRSPEEFTLEK